jgi:hypothetical protein
MQDVNQLFQKNFRKGLLGIVTPILPFFSFWLLMTESEEITGLLFLLSGIFFTIFISGCILYFKLEKSIKKEEEIKNIYVSGLVISVFVFIVLNIAAQIISLMFARA